MMPKGDPKIRGTHLFKLFPKMEIDNDTVKAVSRSDPWDSQKGYISKSDQECPKHKSTKPV